MPKKGSDSRLKNIQNANNFNSNHAPFELRMNALNIKNASGRRVLAFQSIIDFVDKSGSHQRTCSRYNLKLAKENIVGLDSTIGFICACGWTVEMKSNASGNTLPLNDALLWGCQNSAIGYDDVVGLTTALEVPSMCQATFLKHQTQCKDQMVKSVDIEIKEAGQEERELAVEAGDFVIVEGNQYPCTRVIVDGGWSKRSYGKAYNANSGVAVIIGSRTGKVLFMSTRTKTCQVCTLHEKSETVPDHDCNKNWSGSSTAMETSILTEGFQNSISMHGLVYSSFVGDGDSSVFANIENVYHGIRVEKVECINHVVRCFRNKLYDISKNTVKGQNAPNIPLPERRMFNKYFPRFEIAIRSSVEHYMLNSTDSSWQDLRADIKNIPFHVFGEHKNCKDYFCDLSNTDEDLIGNVKKMLFWIPLQNALQRVADLSRSLIEKETSNKAENFMSIANKYIEGKRKNFGQGYLYKLRMIAAVFSYNNSRFWILKAYQNVFSTQPSPAWFHKGEMAYIERIRKGGKARKYKSNVTKTKEDEHYGPNSDRPDMPESIFNDNMRSLRESLSVDEDMKNWILENTKGQSCNPFWFNERRNRLTASNAGKIFKLKPETDNTSVLNTILGRNQYSGTVKALQWGKDQEVVAVKEYEKVRGFANGTVAACGLFVSTENGIFGASPDGLIGEDGILEVKCPFSLKDKVPQDWPSHAKYSSPLTIVDEELVLKQNHLYFYQIVMSLYVSRRKWCDFFVWTPHGHFLQRIEKNEQLDSVWKSLSAVLETFWIEDLAPELVDSRFERGREYRCNEKRSKGRKSNLEKKRQKDSSVESRAIESCKRRKT